MLEASFDVRSMGKTSDKVFVVEVMGRYAGWIAAVGGLVEDHGLKALPPLCGKFIAGWRYRLRLRS